MSDNRTIVPMYCAGCGAPLNDSLTCQYCGVRHERVRRYEGPEIPEWSVSSRIGYLATSTVATTSTAAMVYPGSYELNPSGNWEWYSD